MDFADIVRLIMAQRRAEREKNVEQYRADDVLQHQQRWFCGFDNESTLRRSATWIVRHRYFRGFVLAMILLNTLGLAAYDPVDQMSASLRNQVLDVADMVFNIVFTVELLLKLVAIGPGSGAPPAWYFTVALPKSLLAKIERERKERHEVVTFGSGQDRVDQNQPKKKKFMESTLRLDNCCCGSVRSGLILGGWNMLDIVVVVFAWLVFALEFLFVAESMQPGNDSGVPTSLTSLRALRALKILRTGRHMPRMTAMVDDVLASIPLMSNVAALLCFIFFVFGLAGTRFFGEGAFRRRCWEPRWNVTANTSIYIVPNDAPICGAAGYTCLNEGAVCSIFDPGGSGRLNENPSDGFVGFDNILLSFLTIFNCLSLEGWVDVMYNAQDAVGPVAVLFFVPLILLGSLFVIQLTLAVVANNYTSPDDIVKKGGFSEQIAAKEFDKKRVADHADSHHSIDVHHETHVDIETRKLELQQEEIHAERQAARRDSRRSLGLKPMSVRAAETAIEIYAGGGGRGDEERTTPQPWLQRIKMWVRGIVASTKYQWFMMVLIMINTILLAIDFHPMPQSLEENLDAWQLPFTIVFAEEVVVKLWAMGYHDWKAGSFNVFDGVVVVLDVFGTIVGAAAGPSSLDSVSVLRTLRLLRVFKLAEFWTEFKKSIDTVMRSIEDVLNFAVVLLLVIFVAALVGMGIFGGRYVHRDANGQNDGTGTFEVVPRGNFNSLIWALITIFNIIMGENWNEVMMDHMKIDPVMSVVFFVTIFCFGQFILLNIFLVILLENESNGSGEGVDSSECRTPSPALQSSPGYVSGDARTDGDGNIELPVLSLGEPLSLEHAGTKAASSATVFVSSSGAKSNAGEVQSRDASSKHSTERSTEDDEDKDKKPLSKSRSLIPKRASESMSDLNSIKLL